MRASGDPKAVTPGLFRGIKDSLSKPSHVSTFSDESAISSCIPAAPGGSTTWGKASGSAPAPPPDWMIVGRWAWALEMVSLRRCRACFYFPAIVVQSVTLDPIGVPDRLIVDIRTPAQGSLPNTA